MSTPAWSGRKVAEARAVMARTLPAACGQCGRLVTSGDEWVVGHIRPRSTHPALTWVVSNWRVEHRACSDSSSQSVVIEKAKAEALAEHGFFPGAQGPGEARLLPVHTHGGAEEPLEVREGLTWAELCRDAPDWLTPFLEVPEDAAAPLWVSSVHPEAVGSYGPEAIAWMEAELKERGRPLRLRWWQKLAFVLQLQHRADGSLCFRVVLESGPRRIGKSVRLRGSALWRLEHGPDLFEPEQLVVHTGKDLAIVREVLRKAYGWAAVREGWDLKKGMTEPEVSREEVNRWVARSKDSTTGYDSCLAHADECWDIKPPSIDDDLEPSMLERQSPQLVLTSTAHTRATSLMPGRILDALTVDDGETLVLLWGAPPDADVSDPVVWRAASPHWSEDRARVMATKYAKALAGEADPEFDDMRPMEGFCAQYLNQWRLRQKRPAPGTPLLTEDAWGKVVSELPGDNLAAPDAIALESSWFGDGVWVACAWRQDDAALVTVTDYPDLPAAAAAVKALTYRFRVTVGASLVGDPALKGLRVEAGKERTPAAVQEISRLLTDGHLRHDGGAHLSGQVLAVRTAPGVDTVRIVSQERTDALKAAVWAVRAARSRRPQGRMVLPK